MGKITLILGGARSGKSSHAVKMLTKNRSKKVAFIATCQGLDGEMRSRIGRHKKSRPKAWQTFDEPRNVADVLNAIGGNFDWIVIDCLTMLVTNLLLRGSSEPGIESEIDKMLISMKKARANILIVSNEVGLGIVPANRLGRRFRDIAGRANQLVAARAESIIFMVSGIPWRIK